MKNIKTVYNYKLNEPVWDNCDTLRVEFDFQNNKGYVVVVRAVKIDKNSLIGYTVTLESSAYFPPLYLPLVFCKNATTEKRSKALFLFNDNAKSYANKFIERYNLTRRDIKIVEE